MCLFVGGLFLSLFYRQILVYAGLLPQGSRPGLNQLLALVQNPDPQLWYDTFIMVRMSGYGGVATQDWRKGGGGRQDYSLQGLDQDWINVTLPHLR